MRLSNVHLDSGIWSRGDVEGLKDYLTEDLIAELSPQIAEQAANGHPTEVVLLNAELLGMEQVAGGHLASVRFQVCCAKSQIKRHSVSKRFGTSTKLR